MEQLWKSFILFVKRSLFEKFKAFFPGLCMGLIASRALLFSGLPAELVTVGAYIIKYIGTCFLALSSGLCTSYAAILAEKWFKNKSINSNENGKSKKDNERAA
jgi:hypothetical protein